MSPHFSFLQLLTALTGAWSLTTVSEVSVAAGSSITIPCLYEPKFRDHVKYLCRGYDWLLCKYVMKSTQAPNSLGMISDDTSQQVFTVTIRDVQTRDAYYWCAVERIDSDMKQFFELVVTTGVPGLRVDNQRVKGFVGEDLTITFHHSNTGETQWCRLGGLCVRWPSGEIDGTAVIITLLRNDFFTVTMRTLRTGSRGWYFCTKGALRMPVHITVEQRPPTKPRMVTVLSPTTSERVKPTSASAASEVPTTKGDKSATSSDSPSSIIIIIIVTVSLVFIVMVTIVILLVLKTCKKIRTLPATTAAGEETYSEVTYTRNSHGESIRVPASNDTHATYSTLATQK